MRHEVGLLLSLSQASHCLPCGHRENELFVTHSQQGALASQERSSEVKPSPGHQEHQGEVVLSIQHRETVLFPLSAHKSQAQEALPGFTVSCFSSLLAQSNE